MTTRHDCGGPVFGRKLPGCPRCDELIAGAEPIRWASSRRETDEAFTARLRAHNCTASNCGPICVAFDW